MGIESDQLVYDYLSRVGDIAQRRADLTSADRMRLVSRLRTEIERRRASEGADTPSAVQRILTGLGSPDEAVDDAGAAGSNSGSGSGSGSAGRVPSPRREGEPARAAVPAGPPSYAAPESPATPAGAGADEMPDWWRTDASPYTGGEGAHGAARGTVHGFTGGIEIPDILKPPPLPGDREPSDGSPGPGGRQGEHGTEGPEGVDEYAEEDGAQRATLFRRADGAPVPPLLLLVALILLVGAVLGNWIVLAVGWGLAYLTRKLSHSESKWAVMGVPGLVVAAGIVWLWGRTEGRWGDPVPEGGLGAAMSDTWPWVLRAAAVGSAMFVVWRSRRPG
ncbi:hypothetical protein [Streptomyces telluris]|uniref:Uncharacterized protein n=1 Tax=Streptomyces telluris TaxID=2720021 RepID=A0A9X2LDJ2_9ACTN|nr:hypothetical protein [Streptomyces telluris]MCQ8769161.1 hypothetical protein [Streptomyces telluris]NJP75779.1 hypothetical protein [Streptomyces telluris]